MNKHNKSGQICRELEKIQQQGEEDRITASIKILWKNLQSNLISLEIKNLGKEVWGKRLGS